MKKSILFLFCILTIYESLSQGLINSGQKTWFEEEHLLATILLEKKDSNNNLVPHGTGFLMYSYLKGNYVLVTCAHILKNDYLYFRIPVDSIFKQKMLKNKKLDIIVDNIKFYLIDNYLIGELKLIKNKTYVTDDSLDIGALPFSLVKSIINKDTIDPKTKGVASRSQVIYRKDILLGEEVYFIGFPNGIGTEVGFLGKGYLSGNAEPIIRSGSVAWASKKSKIFLLDAYSTGGNSGSPIFQKITLTNSIPRLCGMIIGHLPDSESSNMGLVKCLYMDDIIKVVSRAEKL